MECTVSLTVSISCMSGRNNKGLRMDPSGTPSTIDRVLPEKEWIVVDVDFPNRKFMLGGCIK